MRCNGVPVPENWGGNMLYLECGGVCDTSMRKKALVLRAEHPPTSAVNPTSHCISWEAAALISFHHHWVLGTTSPTDTSTDQGTYSDLSAVAYRDNHPRQVQTKVDAISLMPLHSHFCTADALHES